MVHERGRWDVGTKDNAVYVERVSENGEQLFNDVVAPDEARKLAGLLTKYADKADEAADSDDADSADDDADQGSDDSEDSDKSAD